MRRVDARQGLGLDDDDDDDVEVDVCSWACLATVVAARIAEGATL